jgi:hypothetical protein
MNKVYFDSKAYQVPGSWDELDAWQLLRISRVLFEKMSFQEKRIRIILILLKVRKSWRLSWLFTFKLSPEARHDLIPMGDFILDSLALTKDLIKEIPIRTAWNKKMILKGPAGSLLDSLVFMQFIYLEQAYSRLRSQKLDIDKNDSSDLDTLAGLLYSYEKFDADNRMTYQLIGQRIPGDIKLSALLMYEGNRSKWLKLFPYVFKPADKGSEDHHPISSDGSERWVSALRSLAGGALHMEEMAYVKADLALYDLNEKIREAEELERNSRR